MEYNPAITHTSNSAAKYQEKTDILWKQLLSLATLYASVIIGWIAYYNYQPILLETYNFTSLTMFLFIVQGIIMVIAPPIAGRLGDKFRVTAGKRLPIISAGVSFAAMIFMATAFTLFTEPGPIFKWILPVLITLWLFSMAIFTSPAISTIELFVPSKKLPTAMAVLTIVYGLLYALEPIIVDLVNFIGAPLTFVVGGVAVFFSGLLLKRNSTIITDKPKPTELAKSDFTYAFILGIALGLATTVLFNLFPALFEEKGFAIFGVTGDGIASIILAAVALLSLPMSKLTETRSVYMSILLSIVATLAVTAGIFLIDNHLILTILIILFIVFYALMSVSFLPLALSVVKDKQKVFGVGIFFAGFELPNGILEAILVYQGKF
ncbi:MFS transporter [Marinoscillum sp.]|uniref:MFS transporter n=1 Tax=Marinoscillum sp. TaxID=2024838 RepID=UPI003BAB9A80